MNLKGLSLHEKICQMMVVKANPKKHINQYGSIKNFMQHYPVGGIFICNEIISDTSFTKEKIRDTIAEYQKYSKIPLLVAADSENGSSFLSPEFTNLPSPMALSSANDKLLAYDYGKAIAKECTSIGVNWAFAPVCDMNINRYNEIVGTRSISDNPDKASEMLCEVVKGFQENGMLTTGKHFPGDGCDIRNQHIVGSVNNLSKEDWMNTYGKVYKGVFKAGMSAVMVGHISVPAYQNDQVDGVYPPATLSKDAIDLLKQTLGFKGVALTDAMDMGGFVRWKLQRREAEVQAFKIGLDMMLWPREETSELIEKAILNGEIPMSRLDDAIERIEHLKHKLEPFGFNPIVDETKSGFSRDVRDKLALKSSTLVHNSVNIIPVSEHKITKVRIVVAANYFLSDRSYVDKPVQFISDKFKSHGAQVDVRNKWDVYLEDLEAGEIDRNYDLIVYCAFSNSALPMPGRELVNIHSAQRFDDDKTIVMVIGTPHYITEYFPTAETIIHTYNNKECLKDAIDSIYGEKKFMGKLPIII